MFIALFLYQDLKIMNIRTILKVLLVLFALAFVVFGYGISIMNSEKVTPVKTLNPQSSGPKALIVYQNGLTDFQSKATESFAQNLVSNGWHVKMTTASSQTPTDFKDISLLVLGSPIYGGQASTPLQTYMKRLEPLGGLRVVTLLTGAGAGDKAKEIMTSEITAHGGKEVLSIVLYQWAPNEEQFGSKNSIEIAAKAAQSLTP
jgi:flavorubredoxin